MNKTPKERILKLEEELDDIETKVNILQNEINEWLGKRDDINADLSVLRQMENI